ncbi:hypothetical protein L7F22_041634 [Adiantum nelumboides]|nr:hypothetical protein [Adiantum nelumboides]
MLRLGYSSSAFVISGLGEACGVRVGRRCGSLRINMFELVRCCGFEGMAPSSGSGGYYGGNSNGQIECKGRKFSIDIAIIWLEDYEDHFVCSVLDRVLHGVYLVCYQLSRSIWFSVCFGFGDGKLFGGSRTLFGFCY